MHCFRFFTLFLALHTIDLLLLLRPWFNQSYYTITLMVSMFLIITMMSLDDYCADYCSDKPTCVGRGCTYCSDRPMCCETTCTPCTDFTNSSECLLYAFHLFNSNYFSNFCTWCSETATCISSYDACIPCSSLSECKCAFLLHCW